MGAEARGRSVVDAGRVDPHGLDPPVLHEPRRRLRREPRKPELRDRVGAGRRGAEIRFAIAPAAGPARPQEHDHVQQLPAVPLLPGHEVVGRDLIDRVGRALGRDVDQCRLADEPLGLHLVGRVPSLGEVPRCVQMRAAMLGGREPVGRVVVALGRGSILASLELEALFRGPVDRGGIERMGEIDPATGGEVPRGARPTRGHGGCSALRRQGCRRRRFAAPGEQQARADQGERRPAGAHGAAGAASVAGLSAAAAPPAALSSTRTSSICSTLPPSRWTRIVVCCLVRLERPAS